MSAQKVKQLIIFIYFTICFISKTLAHQSNDSSFYPASHPYIQYIGRVDFSDSAKPKFWTPGVYITIRFSGTFCILNINDEERWGSNHNYLEIKVDNQPAYCIQTKARENRIILASKLKKGKHTIVVCKNTEANIGYLQPVGIICEKLLPAPNGPKRKIEFYGNSITCGTGLDVNRKPCGSGQWYDQHNAYMAYGPLSARALKAQWQLSAVSGIGLIHSCCGKTTTMPQVFDKINMSEDSLEWDFKKYQPDIVTICLGQNDGIQDSATFCTAYIQFLKNIRSHYLSANIVLLSSPMADSALNTIIQKNILSVEQNLTQQGDQKIAHYFYQKRYHNGCTEHPDANEHLAMAKELTSFLKRLMKW